MGFRKLLIMSLLALLFISCKPSGPCLLKCCIASDKIEVVLNSDYKIGTILGGCVGDVEFAKYYTENFDIVRDEKKIVITIYGDNFTFVDGDYYKIHISWNGGNIETLSKFVNGDFEIESEKYFNKGPF